MSKTEDSSLSCSTKYNGLHSFGASPLNSTRPCLMKLLFISSTSCHPFLLKTLAYPYPLFTEQPKWSFKAIKNFQKSKFLSMSPKSLKLLSPFPTVTCHYISATLLVFLERINSFLLGLCNFSLTRCTSSGFLFLSSKGLLGHWAASLALSVETCLYF